MKEIFKAEDNGEEMVLSWNIYPKTGILDYNILYINIKTLKSLYNVSFSVTVV